MKAIVKFWFPDEEEPRDFELRPLTVLFGRNGSGKTLLLRTLCASFYGYKSSPIEIIDEQKKYPKLSNTTKPFYVGRSSYYEEPINKTSKYYKNVLKEILLLGLQLEEFEENSAGTSGALNIILALNRATKGQLVILENPEGSLHFYSQRFLADVILRAVNRGVWVIVETQSDILQRGILTNIAMGNCSSDKVIFHWVERPGKITSTELTENGSYNFQDWPYDLGDIDMKADMQYIYANASNDSPYKERAKDIWQQDN